MKMMTIAQAAAALTEKGIPMTTQGVYRLIKRGKLPHVRLNRIYITDLDGFLEAQAKASTEQVPSVRVPTQSVAPIRVPPAVTLAHPKRRRFGTPARDLKGCE